MKLSLTPASTSIIIHIFAQDTAATNGDGKTGLVYGDITAYYVRAGGTLTAMTLETIGTLGTWASTGNNYLGFKLLHDTNAPGGYEVHLPNNILVAGANQVTIFLRATGAFIAPIEIQLANVPVNTDPIADAVWDENISGHSGENTMGLWLANANGYSSDIYGIVAHATYGNSAILTAVGTRMATFTPLTAAQIATGVWQDATAGDFTVSSSIGKSLYTTGVVPGGAGGLFIAGTNAATVITTSLTVAAITLTTPIVANVTQLNGTSIAGTSTYVADAFVAMFNVAAASARLTVASYNQGADGNVVLAKLATMIEQVP